MLAFGGVWLLISVSVGLLIGRGIALGSRRDRQLREMQVDEDQAGTFASDSGVLPERD